MVRCQIVCLCGGTVTHLVDGIYYYLTKDIEIIFRGRCDVCGEEVQVTRNIQTLMLMCPMEDRGAN